jgi:hypothetical protein
MQVADRSFLFHAAHNGAAVPSFILFLNVTLSRLKHVLHILNFQLAV